MLTPRDAARTILSGIAPLPAEPALLAEALGRVLAADLVSPIDLPPWTNSAMDGFAARAADVTSPGVELRVLETVHAGHFPTRPVGASQCTRVFTGAPLPEGADGVIRQEDVTPLGPDRVRVDRTRDAGRNIRHRGEDIRKGSTVLGAGTWLGPAQLGVLASVAAAVISVRRRPRVAFMGSGDEIVEPERRDDILSGRKIASSNSYTLDALIRMAGADPVNLGIARDDPADVRRRFTSAAGADLLVTSAGVSVGEHDHVRAVFQELGGTLTFWRIQMRPGAPVAFGHLRGVPWIGLPGNPVSTMVTFELFVRPAIRRMLGMALPFRRTVRVRLTEPVNLGPPLRHFLRAVVTDQNGGRAARLTGPQGSGILTSMVLANALLIVPEDRQTVAAGEELDALLLEDAVHVADAPY
ncbi:MAG TPA: gephyrin-like molybdotransferase Glp [Gemmatimonadales bacterium]|nr:gephyrin-like molybdotransferase Glp [Gemmatimonadales bacterium]